MKKRMLFLLLGLIIFNSCSQLKSGELLLNSPLRFEVKAFFETTPIMSANDAADDICVWAPNNPSQPIFVIGTDKKRGLETYDEKGRRVFEKDFGRVNNVDLWNSPIGPVVVASNRTHNSIDFYQLNSMNGSLKLLSRHKTELDDVYGITVYNKDEEVRVFITDKKGTILQYNIELIDQFISVILTDTYRFSSTVEGIKGDPYYQRLYVAEEDKGLWIIDLKSDKIKRNKVHKTDKKNLIPDLEGVALLDLSSGEGYLFVSVQGNNSYAIFDRKTLELIALFQITKGNIIGGVEETDGIEIVNQDKFSYFIAQDGINEGHQNFKFVKLDEIISKIR